MNKQNDITIFEDLITFSIREMILRSFFNALEATNELLRSNTDFFDGSFLSNIRQDLLSFSIYTGLYKTAMGPDAVMSAEVEKVNKFQRKNLCLMLDKLVLTVCKNPDDSRLPNAANYMKRYAQKNCSDNEQLSMISDNYKYGEFPYYGIITYGVSIQDFEHITILMPDNEFKKILTSLPIYGSSALIKKEDYIDEVQIAQIKKDAKDTIAKLKII